MTSAIKQRNPNPLTQGQVQEYISGTKVSYTTDHTVDATEIGKRINHSALATAAHTFEMPTLTALNDGAIYVIQQSAFHKLTIKPESSSDKVWENSGFGYGIELPDRGSWVMLQGDYASHTYDIIGHGGRVIMEGLVLHDRMDTLGSLYSNNTLAISMNKDITGKHGITHNGGVDLSIDQHLSILYQTFNGSSGFNYLADSTDWDIFGTQTGVKTVAGWVYFDLDGSKGQICIHYQDASNYWYINRNGSNYIGVEGSGSLSAYNTTTTLKESWNHVAVVVRDTIVGVYVNGQQIAYDDAWTTITAAAALYFGRDGTTNYLDGRMQDWHISYNDPYGCTPNDMSGTPDTFSNMQALEAPFVGVLN